METKRNNGLALVKVMVVCALVIGLAAASLDWAEATAGTDPPDSQVWNANLPVAGTVKPTVTATYDLGTSLLHWVNGYVDNLIMGTASSTTGSRVTLFDGGGDNKPAAVALYDDQGSPHWLFFSSAGALRMHSAYPTDDDADGVAMGTLDQSVDFDLTAAGGNTADPDFSVAGYSKLAGALEVDGATTLDGAVTIGDAAADVVTVNSDDFQFTAGAVVTLPATAYFTQMRIGTGSADGHASVGTDDLRVEGDIEVDGTLWADGAAEVAGTFSPTGLVTFGDKAELTLDGAGAITATGVYHTVDTLGDAASGDLVTITAGAAGQMLIIQAEHTDRTIVVKSTGNILPVGGDISIANSTGAVTMIYSTALSKWVVLSSYGN